MVKGFSLKVLSLYFLAWIFGKIHLLSQLMQVNLKLILGGEVIFYLMPYLV